VGGPSLTQKRHGLTLPASIRWHGRENRQAIPSVDFYFDAEAVMSPLIAAIRS
jgi:hypothetical protein